MLLKFEQGREGLRVVVLFKSKEKIKKIRVKIMPKILIRNIL